MATVTPCPAATVIPAGVAPAAWSSALDEAYAKAQTAMPDAGERLARALALVRAGAVEHAAQWGVYHYRVASASDPTGLQIYDVHAQAPLSCTCPAWTQQAKKGKGVSCTHLLATWLYRRALEQVGTTLSEAATTPHTRPNQAENAATLQGLPEAAFSITLKGTMRGHEVLLTARGQTWEAFQANVARLSGLLDAPAQPQAPSQSGTLTAAPEPTPEGWCVRHSVQMKRNHGKDGRQWYSHRTDEGWCKGK